MRSVVDFYECLQCKTSFCMHIILPTGLTVLAQYPNVYCKVSGLCTADKSWTVQTYVENSAKPCMEIFGKDRYIGIFIIAMRISRGNKNSTNASALQTITLRSSHTILYMHRIHSNIIGVELYNSYLAP